METPKIPFVNVVKKHQSISDNAFNAFTKTMSKLTKAEANIDSDIQKEEDKAAKALANKQSLIDIKTKNANFNKKLAEFLGV